MKKIIFYIFGIFLSIFVAILFCELFSRLFFGGIFRNDPVLLRNSVDALIYKENQSSKFVSFEWDVEVSINERGFRDRNNIYESKNNKVLILGDSFTEGFGVEMSNSYPKKLEKLLNDSDYSFDVYNAGITGNNIVDYLEIYNNYFANDDRIKTIVIGLFPGNDLKQNYKIRDVAQIKKQNISSNIRQFASKNSTFYNVINRFLKSNYKFNSILKEIGVVKEKKKILSNYHLKNTVLFERINFSTDLIGKFKKKIKDKKLLIILIPSKEQIDDKYWNQLKQIENEIDNNIDRKLPTTLIENSLNVLGVDVINLYDMFSQLSNEKEIYFKYDPHINVNGHSIISEVLFKKLISYEVKDN